MSIDLFDRALLRRRRARAAAQPPGAGFLLARAAEELAERLALVARRFPLALELGSSAGALQSALAGLPGGSPVGHWLVMDSASELAARGAGAAFAGDEERLAVAPGSLDLVVSPLVLQYTNDLPGALVQARLALKPDGLFLAALVGGESLMELRECLLEAENETTGGASPRVHPMIEVRSLGSLLQRAGFALPVVDSDRFTVRYRSPLGLLHDLKAMGATNALFGRSRRPATRALIARALTLYAERFEADGHVPATFEILHASGWAPAASQPRPLAPGSAKARLAAALGSAEIGLGEKAGG